MVSKFMRLPDAAINRSGRGVAKIRQARGPVRPHQEFINRYWKLVLIQTIVRRHLLPHALGEGAFGIESLSAGQTLP